MTAIERRQSINRTGEELAISRQLDLGRKHGASLGFNGTDVFQDNDVLATTGIVRLAFERLLSSGHTEVDVWHQDRILHRSKGLERVLDTKMIVHTVKAGSVDLSFYQGQAVARTVASWATYERQQKAARQCAAAKQRAEMGNPWWPTAPFGLEKSGDQASGTVPSGGCSRRLALAPRWHSASTSRILTSRRSERRQFVRAETATCCTSRLVPPDSYRRPLEDVAKVHFSCLLGSPRRRAPPRAWTSAQRPGGRGSPTDG